MKHLLTLLLLSLAVQAYGQRLDMSIDKENNGDTSYWYNNTVELCKHLGLDAVRTSPHKFHIRLWATDNRIVDVWESNDNEYHATLAFWATKSRNGRTRRKLYYQHWELDSLTTVNLVKTIYTSNLLTIPTQDSIDGWGVEKVLGGIYYNIEIKENNQYSFKEYDNPGNRINVPEAKLIDSFICAIDKHLEIDARFNTFYESIPFKYPFIAGYISYDNNTFNHSYKVLKTEGTANKTNSKSTKALK